MVRTIATFLLVLSSSALVYATDSKTETQTQRNDQGTGNQPAVHPGSGATTTVGGFQTSPAINPPEDFRRPHPTPSPLPVAPKPRLVLPDTVVGGQDVISANLFGIVQAQGLPMLPILAVAVPELAPPPRLVPNPKRPNDTVVEQIVGVSSSFQYQGVERTTDAEANVAATQTVKGGNQPAQATGNATTPATFTINGTAPPGKIDLESRPSPASERESTRSVPSPAPESKLEHSPSSFSPKRESADSMPQPIPSLWLLILTGVSCLLLGFVLCLVFVKKYP